MDKNMHAKLNSFRIAISDEVIADLHLRLAHVRWPTLPHGAGWKAGTEPEYLRQFVDYWQRSYDWRAHEARLNGFMHFKATVHDIGVHFIYERGKGPNPMPIILTHGYPDSFCRFLKLIPMLTDPASYGGQPQDAFDVIVPDLPGYGFSDKPQTLGTIFRVHDLWAQLMTEILGYNKFVAHGGDWGSTVTEQLARSHPDAVLAIHLTDVPFGHLYQKPDDLSSEEKRFMKENEEWMQKKGAYALIQSTKPNSLSPGLNDSPVGLAAWMIEKFRSWSDCDGKLESRFTKDELLTHVMVYWTTQSIATSFLPYFEYANASALTWIKESIKNWIGQCKVPAAFARFPKDISSPPREWAARFFDVQRWTEMPRGGHFAAMEEPQLLAEDLRTWFRQFRN